MNLIDKICNTPNTLIIIPAYGRVYDNDEDALKDWNDGKDFKIQGGPYCSIRDKDLIMETHDKITINYYRGIISP